MARAIDPDKHEANKLKFLSTLYDISKAHISERGGPLDLADVYEWEQVIGERAGFTPQESARLGADLEHDGKLRYEARTTKGDMLGLTRMGINEVDRVRFDRTFRGKSRKSRRWLAGVIGTAATKAAESTWGWLVGAIGGYALGVISADEARAAGRWVLGA